MRSVKLEINYVRDLLFSTHEGASPTDTLRLSSYFARITGFTAVVFIAVNNICLQNFLFIEKKYKSFSTALLM